MSGEGSTLKSSTGSAREWPKVTIIIATHNGAEFLTACLESVFSQTYPVFEVIFVDNASTDGSSELVRRQFPAVRVISSDTNLGYGGGNNLGAQAAEGSMLLFLNHDTIVTEEFLFELVMAVESSDSIAMAQSKIVTAADPRIVETTGAFLTRTGMWIHQQRWEPDDSRISAPMHVMAACGTCLLVRRSAFEMLGGFDDDFVVYYDDADLSWRAWLAGYQVISVPKSVIRHWGSGTTKALPSRFTVFHSFKNRLCSLIKLLSPTDLIQVLPVHILLCLAGAAAYLLRLKLDNCVAVLQALLWNVHHLPETVRKRRDVRNMLAGDHSRRYRDLIRSLPIRYFMRTSLGYVARW